VLDQNAEYSGSGGDNTFAYKGILIPRASGLIGNNAEFYVSAGLNYKADPWAFAPELLQTEITGRTSNLEFTVGRMNYSDPLGYAASGLFDGGQLTFNTDMGNFSAGAWYTGLLYKRRANIEMTEDEWTANNSGVDYGDFVNTYFAPRRALAAIGWEHKGLWEKAIARLSILGQFDLTGAEEKVHSQYLAGKAAVPFGAFSFSLGGCFELIEANDDIGSAFAAELGVAWRNSVHYLSFGAKYSSGASDTFGAFLPLTTNTVGQVLEYKLSGLSMFSLDYTARLYKIFSAGLYPAYFMLTDSANDKRILGGEIFAALYWSPASDINVNLGGGVFLPSLGNVSPDGKNFWRVELNVILSLF
jgi:hypothetical protein